MTWDKLQNFKLYFQMLYVCVFDENGRNAILQMSVLMDDSVFWADRKLKCVPGETAV